MRAISDRRVPCPRDADTPTQTPTAPNVCHGLLAWRCLPRRRRPTPIPPRRILIHLPFHHRCRVGPKRPMPANATYPSALHLGRHQHHPKPSCGPPTAPRVMSTRRTNLRPPHRPRKPLPLRVLPDRCDVLLPGVGRRVCGNPWPASVTFAEGECQRSLGLWHSSWAGGDGPWCVAGFVRHTRRVSTPSGRQFLPHPLAVTIISGMGNQISYHYIPYHYFTFVRLVCDVNAVLEPGTLTLASLALLSIAMLTWRQGR